MVLNHATVGESMGQHAQLSYNDVTAKLINSSASLTPRPAVAPATFSLTSTTSATSSTTFPLGCAAPMPTPSSPPSLGRISEADLDCEHFIDFLADDGDGRADASPSAENW